MFSKDEKTSKGKAPTHLAYHVRDYKDGNEDKSSWAKIGAVWTHEDGKGCTIQLETVPLDGRITLRPVPERDKS